MASKMAEPRSSPVDAATSGKTPSSDPYSTGDAMLERAKQIAQDIEAKVRKLTGDTVPSPALNDGTDEAPPVA
jgi:hypothetical protein